MQSPINTVSPPPTTGEVPLDHITTSSSGPFSSSTEVVVPVDNPTPPGSLGAAIGGAVGAVVVVVLVLGLLSVVVAVCDVNKRRKYRLGNTHVRDPPTIGEYAHTVCCERSAASYITSCVIFIPFLFA